MTKSLTEHSKQDLLDQVDFILAEAKRQGATAAEADFGTGTGISVTVRLGEVEKIEHERDKVLSLTVYMDQRKGSASSSDFTRQALQETAHAACEIARYASEDAAAGLADPELMANADTLPDLDLHHPWPLTPEQAIDLALECETAGRECDSRINNSDGAVVSTYSGTSVYGNSHGFAGGWQWSSHMIDCTLIAEQSGHMQRDGWYSKGRDYHELMNIRDIGKEAARRTVNRLGSRKLGTRQVPVLFEAPVAYGLFAAFITAISGGSLYRRASFLLDSLGKQLFPDFMHIHEAPFIPKALGSAPFDNDGVATRERDIIKDGILQGYVLSAYSARKLGLETTANAGGVHNLIIEPGEDDFDALLKKMDTGLLVTDMIGFGVNQVTGDYSRGASGFWVENGKIQYPVEEITVAGNLKSMYQQIMAVGTDVDWRGNILTGSVLIDNMTVAGE